MNIKEVSPRFFVSEQISANDVAIVAAKGIKTIICNRPHNETADQPETQSIIDATAEAGIAFMHIPVTSDGISDSHIGEFAAAYDKVQGPILAYCRSGMRSTCLWALAEAGSIEVDTILSAAKSAGYDLSALVSRLESRSKK